MVANKYIRGIARGILGVPALTIAKPEPPCRHIRSSLLIKRNKIEIFMFLRLLLAA